MLSEKYKKVPKKLCKKYIYIFVSVARFAVFLNFCCFFSFFFVTSFFSPFVSSHFTYRKMCIYKECITAIRIYIYTYPLCIYEYIYLVILTTLVYGRNAKIKKEQKNVKNSKKMRDLVDHLAACKQIYI